MELLYNVALWILFWPLKFPVWLWKYETIGKVFATLWAVCWLLIGVSFLPRQAEKTGLSFATPPSLHNAEQPSTALTLTKPSPIEAVLVFSPSTLSVTTVTHPFPSKSVAVTIAPTEPPVFTNSPIVIATSTPWLLTSTPTRPPLPTHAQPSTMLPTVLSTMTASPTPAAKLAATPTPFAPVATGEALVIEPTATPAEQVSASNPNGFTCAGGCTEAPDPSCAIKGNVNAKGDKIYHMPGGKNYALTHIKPVEGDRWFCTEQEAQDAGFRAAKSY